MKKLILSLAFVVTVIMYTGFANAQTVYNFDQGLEAAKSQNKIIAIYIYSEPNSVETTIREQNLFRIISTKPNPFDDAIEIEYQTLEPAYLEISAVDLFGREIWKSDLGLVNAGDGTVSWNGLALDGYEVPNGAYIIKLSALSGGQIYSSSKMIVKFR